MIIDDSRGFTKIIKLTLEAGANYEVLEENNPEKGVETARKFRPDLILLDVIMPNLDGGDVLTRIRSDPFLRSVPVVFLTATVRKKEVVAHDGNIGGNFFMAKPVSAEELIACIERHTVPQ
jgi:CheY-like chemotaxis protein